MDIKLTRPTAKVPKKAHENDAGWDLYVSEIIQINGTQCIYDFGVAFDIPQGYVGLVFPRSSISKKGLTLANSVGVIDSGYQGSVRGVFNRSTPSSVYQVGDRAAQIVFLPLADVSHLSVVDEFKASTERGDGGFGSSGK